MSYVDAGGSRQCLVVREKATENVVTGLTVDLGQLFIHQPILRAIHGGLLVMPLIIVA